MDIKKLQKQSKEEIIEEKEMIVSDHLRKLAMRRETSENRFNEEVSFIEKAEKQLLEEDFYFTTEEGTCGFNLIFND